ncbi:flagellar basal-body MS-ring/collar protein FliF [Cellulomonas sp. PhB150]|uniref:flagellar basal-body MS-ring/collar protein FliF n=1 Tax=Cellulomonas sp. PhB150 TaxID=2485188 RepID=UPI000F4A9BB5|nr:flagellar basal-body MS-ring/collar protein FliF [Cellulomonas sp. PhB150]ROS25785.1 flagellar M-ring protein FliF [Cellulomonas sp. PhB150]
MPAQVQAALDRLTGAVKQFSMAQRTLAIIGVAVLVLGAVGLSSWMSRPTMSPLFTSLSGADASAVVDELDAQGVAYQLADGGSTVLVPAKNLYSQRIHLAAEGIPANADGAGYSLLDDMPMTSSEFQQEKTYQRALEGELAKTIGAIDGIDAATVKLAIPEDTVFVATKQDPTASVFVRTRAGVTLSVDQVDSIVHLVSAGIPDMVPTDVSVVDATGKVLSAVGTGTTGASGGRETDYEARVQASVQTLLDRVIGVGKSAVTVTAALNFDETQRTTEKFDATPNTPPLASSTKKESYTGTGSSATGVLGPDQTVVGPTAGDDPGKYSSTTEDVTNSVNKTTEVVTAAPGAVERQSVAVVVDEKAAAALDMAQLQATIAAAAGIDTTRGDTLAVQAAAFDTSQADAAATALAAADAAAKTDKANAQVRQLATVGGVVLLVVVLIILLARRSGRSRRTAVDLGELPVLGGPDGAALGIEGSGADELPVLPPAPRPLEPDPIALKRAEITALADDQPEEVADLLRSWLSTPAGARR